MKIFIDTEFTGLVPNTGLISIGCVAETGEKFYAEFTDYDERLCDDWIKKHVISNLLFTKADFMNKRYSEILKEAFGDNFDSNGGSFGRGDSKIVLREFKEWIENVRRGDEMVLFVSDVPHYDFYLLCNLFGGAMRLPEYIVPWCYDICQAYLDFDVNTTNEAFDAYRIFDISRELIYADFHGKVPEGRKHNALYDAMIIKGIYEGLKSQKLQA